MTNPARYAVFTVLILGSELLAAALDHLVGATAPDAVALLIAIAIALVGAAIALGLTPQVQPAAPPAPVPTADPRIQALEQALAERAEQHRRLRHDLRGVLSPALLTADRLLDNADARVKRAGEMMVLAVERASALMADPEEAPAPASPPAGP